MGKNHMRKSAVAILLAAVLGISTLLTGCGDTPIPETRTEDIVVLYTNDIHGATDENLGLDGVAALRNEMLTQTPYVFLVDCGDSVQGTYLSSASQGSVMIDAKNEVGYDYCVLGNHEFDYRLDQVREYLHLTRAQYLNANIRYTGTGEDPFANTIPYAICDCGGTKVGFVGVTTPMTPLESTPAYFREDGVMVIDFSGSSAETFYACVQEQVDACRDAGADYVILLAHLGIKDGDGVFRSTEVIAHTTGIDVVLDGHSHSVIDEQTVENRDGNAVLLASTGTKLEHIGRLTIRPDGSMHTENVNEYEPKDEAIRNWIQKAKDVYEGFLGETLLTLDEALSISDSDGIRMVRTREMGIGNFCADAYRYVTGAEIGMCNGGGVRADLGPGEVSTLDFINLNPFGNLICSVEVTGAEILDMLEYFYQDTRTEYVKDGKAYGENGSFMQLSGLRCTVHAAIEPEVFSDENGSLTGIGETRRVSDVYVVTETGEEPLDPQRIYSVAMTDYMAKNGGSGMEILLADHTLLIDGPVSDYEALITYAREALGFDLSAYRSPEGRIEIVD